MYSRVYIKKILFICIFHLALIRRCHCSNKQQFRLNNPIRNSNYDTQDSNSDAPDGSYDQSNSSGSIDDETEVSSLPLPNDLSVIRLNDTSVVLRWEFPEAFQDRLQFFKIQHKSAKRGSDWKTENKEIPATTRAYQIDGLKPGNIFFAVIAVYDNDDNATSQAHKFRLRAKSKMPPDDLPEQKAPVIHLKEAKSDYFRFKWTYTPKSKDIEWLGYLVYYRSAHVVSDFTIYSTLDESVEIAEVEPDTPYQAKVVAFNQHGVSEFSDTITIRTDPSPVTDAVATSKTPATTSIPPTHHVTVPNKKPSVASVLDNQNRSETTTFASTTMTPLVELHPTNLSNNSHPNIVTPPKNTSDPNSSAYQTLKGMIVLLLGEQNDSYNLSRYWPVIFCPIIAVALLLIVLLSRNRDSGKELATSSADELSQFDLEFDSFFKNSFPGVEKEQIREIGLEGPRSLDL